MLKMFYQLCVDENGKEVAAMDLIRIFRAIDLIMRILTLMNRPTCLNVF